MARNAPTRKSMKPKIMTRTTTTSARTTATPAQTATTPARTSSLTASTSIPTAQTPSPATRTTSPTTRTNHSKSTRRFVAIDANSLIHRAFHAFPPELATTDGLQVNAVYGFTSMLLRVLSELDPAYLLCAFDMKAPTFRHTEFVDYKGTRKPTDETLIKQFPLVKEVLSAFNVPILEHKGFEADDILATLAEYVQKGRWKGDNLEMVIVTGDKDLLQVAGEGVRIWLPHGSFKDMELYDEKLVEERFGFGPACIPDYKGLKGDPSDNIPGVRGIGDKSATDLIKTYCNLENIYKNLDKIKEKQRKLLSEGEESAGLSRRLATVVRTVPLDVRLEDCLMKDFKRGEVLDIFRKFEFRSLVSKIPQSLNDEDTGAQFGLFGKEPGADSDSDHEEPDTNVHKVVPSIPVAGNEAFMKDIKDVSSMVFLFFETGSAMAGIPIGKGKTNYQYYFLESALDERCFPEIKKLLLRDDVFMRFYGWERLWRQCIGQFTSEETVKVLEQCKTMVEDVGLWSYHRSSGQRDYSLKNLVFFQSGEVISDDSLLTKDHTVLCVDAVVAMQKKYSKETMGQVGAMGLGVKMGGKPIERDEWKGIDMPLALVLSKMADTGIAVDMNVLEEKRTEIKGEIEAIEKMMYGSIGHEININSNRQLADVLFVELGLPVQRKLKTGPSTDESVLQKLKGMHPCIESILEYRERTKMLNTYIEPLIEHAHASHDGRIHSTFHLTGTSTGRLSSDSPNVQNIPIRTELGREIRDVFVAGPDRSLISIDYSQIDLRVMAHFSRDEHMMEDFRNGKDFHASTASRIFEKKESDVSESERRIAKTINFGVLYGLSPFGLSEALGIKREAAAAYIQSYFETYAKVQSFLEETIEKARETGYVETALGRRRYMTALSSNNRMVRAAAEREAINMPIQGTSADIMRVAMVEIFAYVQSQAAEDAAVVLQIHDEFLIEAKKSRAERIAHDIERIMENAMELSIPLSCSVEIGNSLASMEKVAR